MTKVQIAAAIQAIVRLQLDDCKRAIKCLVAEHSWDRVRWAIEECAWRFERVARPSRPRRS